jgi:hypothetical protein
MPLAYSAGTASDTVSAFRPRAPIQESTAAST